MLIDVLTWMFELYENIIMCESLEVKLLISPCELIFMLFP